MYFDDGVVLADISEKNNAFHHIIKDEIFRNKKNHLFINYGSIVDQTGISKLKLIKKNILDNKYVPCFN